MSERERSRSPERDEGAAPAPAPADDYQAAPAADNDTNGGGAPAAGATDDSVKLYVGNLHYGTGIQKEGFCFETFSDAKHTMSTLTNSILLFDET